MRVPVEFYRGGTSRGLVFPASALAPYSQAARNRIICTAMGSPDPDGRQIDGVGGGISSLSKVAVLSVPTHEQYQSSLRALGPAWAFPGVPWADEPARARDPITGYDAVYRFGQVPINDMYHIDWSSTCGNFIAAAASHVYTHHWKALRPRLQSYLREQFGSDETQHPTAVHFPLRLLMADSGKRVEAHIPLVQLAKGAWHLSRTPDTHIAGVPGRAPGIQVHMPLAVSPFPTGQVCDTIRLEGRDVRVSVVDTGLPIVLVLASDLHVGREQMTQTAAMLDTDTALLARVEEVRQQVARLTPGLQALLSPSAPKVCLVAPRSEYTTSGGETVPAEAMDVLVRAVSVGNFHRSIMATALSSLAVAAACPGSVVATACGSTLCAASQARTTQTLRAITVGQPAGTSMAMAQLHDGVPTAVVYDRTARRVLHGFADTPPFEEMWQSKQAYDAISMTHVDE
ncbi:hypothetical protein Malapachy_3266 [Malassezia pachydermatis]|uniref:Uncharacterized protein n=1 Tax=Malassezia pachydermatis TaxID=77020 RepID=A0A0M8MXV9_9BASI|nr:hypothetical protein Malapachy_3266 [Malassezia pachydermatis]KOS15960.1 hypothetical protein Malapachy_3266 [Malassezia pachydermatis]